MKTLHFLNPTFKKGLNYTVRLGDKWRQSEIGEFTYLGATEIGKSINSVIQIQKVIYCRLAEVPQEVYDNEHDEQCHNFKGLYPAMKDADPDYFKDKNDEDIKNTIVTCLGFYIYHANF